MGEPIRQRVLRILRVPPAPAVPDGEEAARVFRAAPNFYRYRLALWVVGQISALLGLIGGLAGAAFLSRQIDLGWVSTALVAVEVLAWAGFLMLLPLSLIAVKLDYEMRWYLLSDRSLRIRAGVWTVREKTMTFANIQQISIRQNPLQRALGISDVEVRTAGGGEGKAGQSGGPGEGMHEAHFSGVDNAEEIRTAIRERVRRHRDAGLGDPDDAAPALFDVDNADAVLAAARALQQEMRKLREAAEHRR